MNTIGITALVMFLCYALGRLHSYQRVEKIIAEEIRTFSAEQIEGVG